jgi:hypothetical protein
VVDLAAVEFDGHDKRSPPLCIERVRHLDVSMLEVKIKRLLRAGWNCHVANLRVPTLE